MLADSGWRRSHGMQSDNHDGAKYPRRSPEDRQPTTRPMMKQIIRLGLCAAVLMASAAHSLASAKRETATVTAIARAVGCIANIHSEKKSDEGNSLFSVDRGQKVNGMGTRENCQPQPSLRNCCDDSPRAINVTRRLMPEAQPRPLSRGRVE